MQKLANRIIPNNRNSIITPKLVMPDDNTVTQQVRIWPSGAASESVMEPPADKPVCTLSIVTRTRDRSALLRRAAQSVMAGAVPGTEWIIVEDASGVSEDTQSVVDEVRRLTDIKCIATANDVGHRAVVGNSGLALAGGEFIHIHDDDDVVQPSFYIKAIDFLKRQPRYVAVRTMCDRVDEVLDRNGVYREKRRRPHYPERRVVSLADLGVLFTCPPIGTLYRASVVKAAGGFDETFDVCEDYDLMLRVLLHGDVGTIPKKLASFHVRPGTDNSPAYYNFEEVDAAFRNELLRRDLRENKMGVGWLVTLGRMERANGITGVVNRIRHYLTERKH